MKFIRKTSAEVVPLNFDFRRRLNSMSDGAIITQVLELEVTPPGSLILGLPQDALINEEDHLQVGVVVTGGAVNTIYQCRCRAEVMYAGGEYIFDVMVNLLVV